MSPESVGAALEEAARVEGLGVGFWSAPGSIDLRSYAELADGARRFAAGLQELGVQPGEPA